MTTPRVTIALATYNRAAYLRQAIESCLAQTFTDFELLVCDNASLDDTEAVVASFGDPRIRYLRNAVNLGMVGNWNRCLTEARGELIANLCDDDLMLPDRLARQVGIFDAHPETGVVHGDAEMIDESGRATGVWAAREFEPQELLHVLVRMHNFLVYPSSTIHRRVFDALGGYAEGYQLAADLDLWLRAAAEFRFRHTPGGPVVRFRRHEGSGSHDDRRPIEIDEVERALEATLGRLGAAALVPEAGGDEQEALVRLADLLEERGLPLPELAARVRDRGLAGRRRIMLTSFGYNDSGGGTIVPRYLSKELVRRGWDVTVFHAAVGRIDDAPAYAVRRWYEDGVRLIGVHNRPHGLLDLGHAQREIDDPPITRAFAEALDRHRPDVVHLHNLHNLGAALLDEIAVRGIRAHFSTHNYWLICPRNYLYTEQLDLCHGPADRGAACATCVGSPDRRGYQERLAEVRTRFRRGIDTCLAVSEAMKRTLVTNGYPEEMIDVVRQAMPEDEAIWQRLGADRAPGRTSETLTVGFFGSAYPQKGPSLLIEAAQRCDAEIRVEIHGDAQPRFAEHLRALDRRGVVTVVGAFDHESLVERLAGVDVAVIPSLWWDCAPLMVAECLAGRVPVLAARMGGIPDFIRDGQDGLLFEGRDVDDLAAKLDRLAGEPGLLEQLQAGILPPRRFAEYVDELERYYGGERPERDRADARPVTVSWHGDQTRKTSLAGINREVCSRLAADDGIALQRVLRSGDAIDGSLPHPAEIEVRHQWPYDFGPSTARLAVIQPWEFGAIPAEWIDPIRRNVDEVWVPSEYVKRMYVAGGIEADRVAVVPNGVDTELFTPDGDRYPLDAPEGTRFLFVGGLIERKAPELLVAAYLDAFQGRDDVCLVIKSSGAGEIYADADLGRLGEYERQQTLPRIVHIDRDLSDRQMAALHRACDVMVLPYRGEGFCMPALEAMASGLPIIATAGGPTDEFVPEAAGWRIASTVRQILGNRVDQWQTASSPFMLEPDIEALRDLMLEADRDGEGRRLRGLAGREAAGRLTWDAVAALYRERIAILAARPPRALSEPAAPFPLEGDAGAKLLAMPAWLGEDRLGDLLLAWTMATRPGQSACLYLIADRRLHGAGDHLADRVMAAASNAGADLDAGADITIVVQPLRPGLEPALHAAAGGFVRLHGADAGAARDAARAGNVVLEPDTDQIGAWLAAALRTAA
jgi:glycosyltransferase involved in cell wall biosynthesis